MPQTTNVLLDPLKVKLIEVIVKHGISDEVSEVVITEPPELKGEHFATETVYAQLRFKDETKTPKNLFVKIIPKNPFHAEMVKKLNVMVKEAAFFNKVLPRLQRFCQDYPGCENLLDCFPKCFYGDDDIIVQENLVLDFNWIMLDKEEYQDLPTAEMVLRNLAKFHGTNYALIQKMGKEKFMEAFPDNVTESFDFADNSMMAPMFDNGLNTCIKILVEHATPGSKETIEKLSSMLGKILPLMEEILTPRYQDNTFEVLNHGDCWNNNMLFKRHPTTQAIAQHIFVDFQITRLGSPSLDLGYYLFTSVKPEVRRAHLQHLLKLYYHEFQKTIQLFSTHCPITFPEFFEDYKKYSRFGYQLSLTMAAAIGAFKDIDMENLGADTEKMMATFNDAISNWVATNPDKAEALSVALVNVVREFDELQGTVI